MSFVSVTGCIWKVVIVNCFISKGTEVNYIGYFNVIGALYIRKENNSTIDKKQQHYFWQALFILFILTRLSFKVKTRSCGCFSIPFVQKGNTFIYNSISATHYRFYFSLCLSFVYRTFHRLFRNWYHVKHEQFMDPLSVNLSALRGITSIKNWTLITDKNYSMKSCV